MVLTHLSRSRAPRGGMQMSATQPIDVRDMAIIHKHVPQRVRRVRAAGARDADAVARLASRSWPTTSTSASRCCTHHHGSEDELPVPRARRASPRAGRDDRGGRARAQDGRRGHRRRDRSRARPGAGSPRPSRPRRWQPRSTNLNGVLQTPPRRRGAEGRPAGRGHAHPGGVGRGRRALPRRDPARTRCRSRWG